MSVTTEVPTSTTTTTAATTLPITTEDPTVIPTCPSSSFAGTGNDSDFSTSLTSPSGYLMNHLKLSLGRLVKYGMLG